MDPVMRRGDTGEDRMTLSPITKRRIATFKANRRGYYSATMSL